MKEDSEFLGERSYLNFKSKTASATRKILETDLRPGMRSVLKTKLTVEILTGWYWTRRKERSCIYLKT